jgi:hypothetical protein
MYTDAMQSCRRIPEHSKSYFILTLVDFILTLVDFQLDA